MSDTLKKKTSVLVPLGVFLILLGVIGPGFLRGIGPTMKPGPLRSLAYVSTDLVVLGLFLGIGFVIVGNRRNKKWESETPKDE